MENLKSLFQKRFVVSELHCVITTTILPGISDNSKNGRHSDCFVYVLEGQTQYFFEGYSLLAQKGDVIYLAKGSLYKMKTTSPYRVIYTNFDLIDNTPVKCELFKNCTSAEELFRLLFSHRLRSDTEMCLSKLYSIYSLLKHSVKAQQNSHSLYLLTPACEYINSHFCESISVEYLAGLCGISNTHLRRLFHDCFGMSPQKYISSLRLDRAKELLRYSSSIITDISAELGFSGVFYFCRFFKKETGMSPNQYRKMFGETN